MPRWIRSTLLTVAGICALGLTTLPGIAAADPAPPPPTFVPGSGNAVATSLLIGPQTGGLTIAVTFGQSLADFENAVGRASSRAIDLGILQTALTGPGCFGKAAALKSSDFPQPLNIDSRDPGAQKGKTADTTAAGGATAGHSEVDANGTPFSHARTTTVGFSVPGVLTVGDAVSETTTRIIDKATREAHGTVDISSLTLAGGMIGIQGLHWDVLQRTGKDAAATATFTIGGLTVAGVKMPIPVGGAELATALAPLNALLLGTGLSIDPPISNTNQDVLSINPLTLRLDHSPLGQAVIAPLLTGAQGIRKPVIDLISSNFACEGALGQIPEVSAGVRGAILPTDIALSALSGTGGLVARLGGASVSTEGNVFANPFAIPPTPAAPFTPSLDLGTPATPALGDLSGALAPAPPPDLGLAQPNSSGRAALASGDTKLAGSRGGTAIVVALLGLLVVLAVALGDYMRIRRGPRVIPEEI